jgi:hypothetical protein
MALCVEFCLGMVSNIGERRILLLLYIWKNGGEIESDDTNHFGFHVDSKMAVSSAIPSRHPHCRYFEMSNVYLGSQGQQEIAWKIDQACFDLWSVCFESARFWFLRVPGRGRSTFDTPTITW